MKNSLLISGCLILLFILTYSYAVDIPSAVFVSPTESNGASINRDWIEVNTSIETSELDTFKFNLNGTDYTIYDNSLILAMNFNNNPDIGEDSSLVVDASKYGNNGHVYGPVWTSNGRLEGAYQFNGITDYIQISDSESLNLSTAASFELWVFPKTIAADTVVFSRVTSGDDASYMLYEGTNHEGLNGKTFRPHIGASGTKDLKYGSINYFITENKWYHVAFTYNSTTGTFRGYINGIEYPMAYQGNNPSPGQTIRATAAPLVIGRDPRSTSYFDGAIDELRIYNRVLSPQEIWLHYQSEFQRHDTTNWGFYANLTNLENGTYFYSVWANNTQGNAASTDGGNSRYLYVGTTTPTTAGVQTRILSVVPDNQVYAPGSVVNTAISLTTNLGSQINTVETKLYGPHGEVIDHVSFPGINIIAGVTMIIYPVFSIPGNSVSGEYTIEAILYDSASNQIDKKTTTVRVGNDPDFYLFETDIKFVNVSANSPGFKVETEAMIHYENSNNTRTVDIVFYDKDSQNGSHTKITSKSVVLSPGTNIVPLIWEPQSLGQSLCVVVDSNDKIKESNENNNEACRELKSRAIVDGPKILDVESMYIGYFLTGVDVQNVFNVLTSGNVDHVEFNMSGQIITDYDGSDGWRTSYNMGDFSESSAVIVTAYNSEMIPSEPFVIKPQILQSPNWLLEIYNFTKYLRETTSLIPSVQSSKTKSINLFSSDPKFEDFKKGNVFEDTWQIGIPEPAVYFGPISLPFDIKLGGGFRGIFGLNWRSDGFLRPFGGGSFNMSFSDNLKAEVKLYVRPSIRLFPKIDWVACDIILDSDFKIPTQFQTPPTFWFRAGINLIFGVKALLKAIIDPIGLESLEISPKVGLEGYGKTTNDGPYNIEGTLQGVLTPTLRIPEPFFVRVTVDSFIKGKLYLFGFYAENTIHLPLFTYPLDGSKSLKLLSLLSKSEINWKPISRDYASSGYSTFVGGTHKSGLRLFDIDPNGLVLNELGSQEKPIIENVFPYSSPYMAADSHANGIMLYVYDDITKPQIRGFEIYYSKFDGSSWSTPSPVTDNYLPEFNPIVSFDQNNNLVAIWTILNNGSIDANSSMLSVIGSADVAFSVLNISTGTWSTPGLLTNDSVFDGFMSLSHTMDAHVVASWVVDKDNDLTTISDRDIYYAVWNGSDWSEPVKIAENVSLDSRPVIAYSPDSGVAVWSQDTDANATTRIDREIFYSKWDGSQWSTHHALTNDVLEESTPDMIYDSAGKIALSWVQRNDSGDRIYMSYYGSDWSTPEPVAESSTLYELRLLADSRNNTVILWQGSSALGQDMFYTVRDGSNDLWNGVKQLTNDSSAEWQLSAAMDSNNNLIVSYVKQNMTFTNETLIEGDSDLNYLIHPISLDVSVTSSSIMLSDEGASPGDAVTINATIYNKGDLEVKSVKVKFSDGPTGPQISEVQNIDTLPAGRNETVAVSWVIPSEQQSHDLYVRVDSDNQISETNEANNVAHKLVLLPDLAFNESDVYYFYNPGALYLNVTVHNFGSVDASDIIIELFDIKDNTTLINSTTIPLLAEYSSDSVSFVWVTKDELAGVHNLSVMIDKDNSIPEKNKENNVANVTVIIVPDIAINVNNVSISGTTEGNITISAILRNIGPADADNVPIFFIDGNIENGSLIANYSIRSLSADTEFFINITWSAEAGSHNLSIIIDPNNTLSELDKSNNVVILPVIVTPAVDLSISSPDIAFYVDSLTGRLNVSAIIHNIGSTDVGYATVEFYNGLPNISSDPYVTAIDNSLGIKAVPFIPSRGGAIVNTSTGLLPGDEEEYNIYVRIDPEDTIPDQNRSNNMAQKIFATASKSFVLRLKTGWNMVSLPLVPLNSSVYSVFGNISTLNTKPVVKWFSPSFISVTELEPKIGYWVFTTSVKNITVTGTEITNKTMSLRAGWNMVGTKGLNSLNLSTIANQTSSKPPVYWVSPSFMPVNITEPGRASWVFVTKNTII
jgi:subtilase family serine protease